ncbi:helix-turn-helix domain-containing protein [Bradyrhizobium sp. STM 3557]|uniref:AraC family transcriptional regulator n=1 Tax=Bradyrhizobium sp. STM 3557 TaxID=578920 RepID=UPI00389097E5
MLLLRVVVLTRSARSDQVSRYSALLLLGIAAYVVESAPGFGTLALGWRLPIHVVDCGTLAIFWIAMGAIFVDDFRLRWYHALAWLALATLGTVELFVHRTPIYALHSALLLLFVLLGVWHALAGRAADLVEGRRRLRILLAVATALYTALTVALDWLWPGGLSAAPLSLANAAGLLTLIFLFAVLGSLLSTAEPFVPAAATAGSTPSLGNDLPPVPSPPGADATTGADAALIAALRKLIEHDKVYREPDLSVASLSQKLGIPEYRLRHLINGQLGQRNFSTFVNGYRLTEAEAALSDPDQADVPILTIALDAGFGSIGPFNRAFKAHTGLTPTEYRRAHLAPSGGERSPIPN